MLTGGMTFSSNRLTESPHSAFVSRILNDRGHYDSSCTEAGVLIAHHRATARPPRRRYPLSLVGGTQIPTITMPTREASSSLLFRQQVISVYLSAPVCGGILA
ncbi:hypothetical protein AVEN_64883-1 [Araneus ventricosus]|uniref:Uncharacterized protein n=1 Tax=Araneus ventricosus TaxID=182803 RepID=A0A4Y2J667_ARAVE|nr:hypothetical protein AVEN_64883-1 [Araneus ventricosus]